MKSPHSLIKIWTIYLAAIVLSVFIHELGHCLVAWLHGLKAIPTFAKEYPIDPIPTALEKYVALGGILGTLSVTILGVALYLCRATTLNSALFAATLSSPAMYSILFALKGRGHDATEFQEAQAAIGASYSGHFLDWLFLLITLAGLTVWVFVNKPSVKALPRLVLGAIVTFIFIVALQKVNNAVFDPLFDEKPLQVK